MSEARSSWRSHVVPQPFAPSCQTRDIVAYAPTWHKVGICRWATCVTYDVVNWAPPLAALAKGGLPPGLATDLGKYAYNKTLQEDCGISPLKKLLGTLAKHYDDSKLNKRSDLGSRHP